MDVIKLFIKKEEYTSFIKTCTLAHCFFKDVPSEAFKKILYVAYVCMYMLSDEYEQLFLYFV